MKRFLPCILVAAFALAAGAPAGLAGPAAPDKKSKKAKNGAVKPVEPAATVKTSARSVADPETIEKGVVAQINAERASQGLAPLVISPELCALARDYSRRMVEAKFFDHRDPDGNLVRGRIEHLGITNWVDVGENIARNRGFGDPAEVAVREWLKSQGHRENILSASYKETGIGVWIGPDKTVYFTQVFLTRKQ